MPNPTTPTPIVKKPEIAADLREAVKPLIRVLGMLESGRDAPCTNCATTHLKNRKEYQASVELGAIINKLERWAESFERGTPFGKKGI